MLKMVVLLVLLHGCGGGLETDRASLNLPAIRSVIGKRCGTCDYGTVCNSLPETGPECALPWDGTWEDDFNLPGCPRGWELQTWYATRVGFSDWGNPLARFCIPRCDTGSDCSNGQCCLANICQTLNPKSEYLVPVSCR